MSSIDLDPLRVINQPPSQEQDWFGDSNGKQPEQRQQNAAIGGNAMAKEFDLANIHSELSSLIDRVNELILETELVFTQLENIYFNQASPTVLNARLLALNQGYHQLFNSLRISGLGALPIQKLQEECCDINTLIESLQIGFQALFNERERRRDGSSIVLGILQPHLPTP